MATDILQIFGTEYTGVTGIKATDDNNTTKTYIRPEGTKSIAENGSNIDVTAYASVSVNVPTGSTINNQNKTVTPSESQQYIIADNGYTGLGTVTVNAITATYVGSGITSRSSSDLSASGATVTTPPGYYATTATKSISNGSVATPASTITANPAISINSAGLITASVSASKSIAPTVSAGYISSGTSGTITVSGSNTSQLSTQAATTITPTTSAQTAVAAGKYTTGIITVAAIPANYIDSSSLKTYYTGSSIPSSSLGSNGDLYFQTTGV